MEKRNKLKQLSIKELIELARKADKKLIIPEGLKKSEIIKILEKNVTNKDIDKYLKEKRTERGLRANYDGKTYESQIMTYFSKKGYKCRLNFKKKGKYEIDIVGEKEEKKLFSRKKRWILVECKNRNVNSEDLRKFVGTYMAFKNRHKEDEVEGWFVYSGIADSKMKSLVKSYEGITLKRIPKKK